MDIDLILSTSIPRQEEMVKEVQVSGLCGVESGQLTQSEWQWPQSAMWSK